MKALALLDDLYLTALCRKQPAMTTKKSQLSNLHLILIVLCSLCGDPVQANLTDEDKHELLTAINNCRSSVTPTAGNMQRLVWSSELSRMAQTFADQCIYRSNHRRHSSFSYPYVGETIAITSFANANLTLLVQEWNNQKPFYSYDDNLCYSLNPTAGCQCRDYLQLIQATASHVGCGAQHCHEIDGYGLPDTLLLVCNYGPGINFGLTTSHVPAQRPFLRAQSACSTCPPHMPTCVDSLCTPEKLFGMFSDPHFSVLLPSGQMLCFSVQGTEGKIFNLLSNDLVKVNALYVHAPNRHNNTYIGAVSITCFKLNKVHITISAKDEKIKIDTGLEIDARYIVQISFIDGEIELTESKGNVSGRNHHDIDVNLAELGLKFSVRIIRRLYIDLTWHSSGQLARQSHGLIGQFFRDGVEIDAEKEILHLPGQSPIPVVLRPMSGFMASQSPEPVCWSTTQPSNQGKGLIKGDYTDYEVKTLIPRNSKPNSF